MKQWHEKSGIWFVYDGDCPICCHVAMAIRIKRDYGELHTIDARIHLADTLITEINRRGYDIDEGMVIYANGQFRHGQDALHFIACYGETNNVFMAMFKGLFWSHSLSRIVYPWLRAARNWFLRKKDAKPIDNLKLKEEAIFKSIFAQSWDELPVVFKKHYANRPYTQDKTLVQGTLHVMCKPPLLWLSPIMQLLRQIPTFNEKNVPVTVAFESSLNSKAFKFDRVFNFSNGKTYKFQSRMLQIENNEVIELMRFGLGWKMRYHWDGEKVILSHCGYVLKLFGHFMPLPLTLIMGAGYAEERAIDDNTFEMITHITHPWWGKIYEYKGRFKVVS